MGLPAIALFFAAHSPVLAQPLPATTQELITRMKRAYALIPSASIFIASRQCAESGYVVRAEVRASYMAPDLLRFTVNAPGLIDSEFFRDGDRIVRLSYRELARMDFVYASWAGKRRTPASLELYAFANPRWELSSAKNSRWETASLRLLTGRFWNGRLWIMLVSEYPNADRVFEHYIDPATYLIWRTVIKSPAQAVTELDARVTELTIGKKFDRADFIPPPEGTQIVRRPT